MNTAEWMARPACREDIPSLGPIEAIGDAQFPTGRFPCEPGSDNVPEAELEKGLEQGLLQVAVDAGDPQKVLAFLLARTEGSHLYLRQIVVLPEWQRMGIGSRLIADLEAMTRQRGLREITLTTFGDIPWNAPLYRKIGFRELDNRQLAEPAYSYLAEELAAETSAGMTHRVAMVKII